MRPWRPRGAPRLGPAQAHVIAGGGRTERDEALRRREVVGERREPAHDIGPGDLGGSALEGRTRRRGFEVPRRGERVAAQGAERGLHDGLEPSAATKVRGECRAHRGLVDDGASTQRSEPNDDARRAEAALGGRRRVERGNQGVARCTIEAFEGGHLAARDPRNRGHAGDAGLAVDQDRAAAALALGCAPVLHVEATELVAERLEQGAVSLDDDGGAVEGEGGRRRSGSRCGQLNELPQPQVWVAVGFVMWNPAPCRPSV